MPTTVNHGAYASHSKYEIFQHKYAAAGSDAYIEVLEIVDAPLDMPNYIINWYYRLPHPFPGHFPGHHCYSFASLDDAIDAWEAGFILQERYHPRDRFSQRAGYREYVHLNDNPWFYDPN